MENLDYIQHKSDLLGKFGIVEVDLTQDEDNDIFGNIDLPAARAETAATLDLMIFKIFEIIFQECFLI